MEKTSLSVFTKLSVMMFFLFFTWGAWLVTLGSYMTEKQMSATALSWAYSVGPIASIITPFFAGFLADRYFNAEKLQGVLLMVSGAFMFLATWVATPEQSTLFVLCLLGHTLCYMPTLGLSNAICLNHLKDAESEYPRVRVLATLGWVIAGLVVSFVFHGEKDNTIFYLSGSAAIAVGIYSMFLPATKPLAEKATLSLRQFAGLDTWPYFRRLSFSVFMFGSLLACMAFYPYWPLAAPYLEAVGIERTAATLSLAQVCELFVLAFVLPYALKKWGIKKTLLLGIACWILRYVLFAVAGHSQGIAIPVVIAAILMHGFAYDFVFVSGYLYVDKIVADGVRAQAQSLLVVFTQGIGFLLGSQILVGIVHPEITAAGTLESWSTFWLIPAVYLGVIFLVLLALFRDVPQSKVPAESA